MAYHLCRFVSLPLDHNLLFDSLSSWCLLTHSCFFSILSSMVLPVSFYSMGSHSTQFSSLVLEEERIGLQLCIFHSIILIFVLFFSFFFSLNSKVLKCCCPAPTEKELEWLILLCEMEGLCSKLPSGSFWQ